VGGSGSDDRRDDGEGAQAVNALGGPDQGTASGALVAAAVEELYGADPQAFTDRRGELTAAARTAGDRVAARAIGALRKPTRAAWVVNGLARSDPSAAPKLAELAAALRAAQQARHGPRLRELSAARGALVDALTEQALAVADVPDPPPSLRLEVAETLTAALADPEVAAAFAEGTLTRAMQWSGFGMLPADPESGADTAVVKAKAVSQARTALTGTRDRPPRGAAGAAQSRSRSGAGQPPQDPAARAKRAGAARAELSATESPAAARRRAEAAEREAAEHAARRREQYEEAERMVTATSAAAAEAGSAEDRLEAEVRDLEQRLGKARTGLEAARLRARRAEAAERRARQALDRLSRG